jgi:hypothetical protein
VALVHSDGLQGLRTLWRGKRLGLSGATGLTGRVPGAALFVGLLIVLAILARPRTTPAGRLGPMPDAWDYTYGAEALLHGSYVVSWEGPERLSHYTPGMSLLVAPSVALGGVDAAVWTCWVAVLVLTSLAGLLAWRLRGPLAGVLAMVLAGFTPAVRQSGSMVMSDVPSAALALAAVALLAFASAGPGLVFAGAVVAFLGWMRPASLVLLLAGGLSLTTHTDWPRRLRWYLLGAFPVVVALGLWQWSLYGSPLTTGYQVWQGDQLFSVRYLTLPPELADPAWLGGAIVSSQLPNTVAYAVQLVGFDRYVAFPAVGIVGFWWLALASWRKGPAGSLARFALAGISLLLLVYAAYFYQSGRFLGLPATLLAIGAAIGIDEAVEQFWTTGIIKWRLPAQLARTPRTDSMH